MTETMTMNRVIHAAVRRDLTRLETALAAFPDGDAERAAALRRAQTYLRDELTRHHVGEDTLIWPMLASVGVDQALLTTMESEHHAMAESLTTLDAAMERLVAEPTAASAAAARTVVADTREVVDQHLAHEERDLEPVLLPHLDSPEWHAVEKQLRKAPPRVAGEFFAWIQDGQGEAEATYLRATVPAPVVLVLSRVFGRGYHRHVAPVWRA